MITTIEFLHMGNTSIVKVAEYLYYAYCCGKYASQELRYKAKSSICDYENHRLNYGRCAENGTGLNANAI